MRRSLPAAWRPLLCRQPCESAYCGDPYAVAVQPQNPVAVIPQPITVPCGQELLHHRTVRGVSSGYVALSPSGEDGQWRSFCAVHWHGGRGLLPRRRRW